MAWCRNQIEMYFDDVFCEKDRIFPNTDNRTHLMGQDWMGVVTMSQTGHSYIKYSVSGRIQTEVIRDFLNTYGMELYHQENSYPYRTFEHQKIFYDVIPIREEIHGYYVVFMLYARMDTPFEFISLEWSAYENQIVYQKLLVENKLTQSREYLNHILDLSGIITYIYDKQFNIVSMSQMARQFLGDEENLCSLRIENIDYLVGNATVAMKSGIKQKLLQKLVTEAPPRILDVSVGPFRNSIGRTVGGIMIAVDITETSVREYEAEQRKLFSMVGDAAVMLAHDINNPLMNIRACAQLLSHGDSIGEDVHREMLGYIVQETERIKETVNQLFSYTNAVSENEYEAIQINDVLQNCINIIRSPAKQLSVKLIVDFDRTLPLTKAMNFELQQVFVRIMFNCLDAMPDGGTLHIESNYIYKEKCIVVRIMDTGVGMSSENLKKIFRPYFTTKSEGHGLGLYACKHIIERYDGKIVFESEEKKGTLCTVSIPVS